MSIRRALEAFKSIGRFACDQGCVLGFPRGGAAFDRDFQQEQGGVDGAGLAQGAKRNTDHFAVGFVAELRVLAQAHQQYALGRHVWHVVQQQGAARFAVHVAALENRAEMQFRCLVQRGGAGREFGGFMDTDHHAGALGFFRA